MLLSFEVLRVASIKKTAFWDVITLMLEAISTVKRQSLSFETTCCNILEGSHLQISCVV
jgi:hypothetical protein